MANEFRAPKSQDFEIVNNGGVVGSLRVKPNKILWAPKGSHVWFGVSLDKFGKFAEKRGTKQKK